jgi:phosphoesterase RecJ-like protein
VANLIDQFQHIYKLILESQRILLSCHIGPDGDSIASNLALKLFLETQGKTVTLVSPQNVSKNFDFLLGFNEIEIRDIASLSSKDFDLFVSVDAAKWEMITKSASIKDWDIPIIVIDHHPINTLFGKINVIDPEASSTAEILCKFFKEIDCQFKNDISQCLLAGIVDDTGGFRYGNTTPDSLEIAADLIRKGASMSEVLLNIYRRSSLTHLRYVSLMLSKIKINKKYKYAWAVISKEDLRKKKISDDETHGVVSQYMPTIEGTDFGFLLEQYSDGRIYCGVRPREKINAVALSKAFGGGGHEMSSGFRFPSGDLKEIEKSIHNKIKEIYSEIKKPI